MSLFLERMVVDEDARAICLDKPIKGLELQLFNSGANMRPYTTAEIHWEGSKERRTLYVDDACSATSSETLVNMHTRRKHRTTIHRRRSVKMVRALVAWNAVLIREERINFGLFFLLRKREC